jgi:hypothetical protein
MICMYSSSLLFSDFLKSDVCWFYSHSVKLLFSLIDNGYSDHENLTHLKGAFVQSSNIQYHVVDWAQNVWEQATPSVWTLRRTRFWHHCDQAIGWLHQRQRSYKQAGVIQRLSENQAHQRVRQYSKNWDYPHEAKLIDVTYGGISQVLGSVDLQIAQWISEDFGVKEISMWIDKLKANDPVMSADYTSLEHLVPLHSIFRSSRCTQETGTRYRWYVNVSYQFGDWPGHQRWSHRNQVQWIQSCTWSVLDIPSLYPGKAACPLFLGRRRTMRTVYLEHIGDLYEISTWGRLRMKSFRRPA